MDIQTLLIGIDKTKALIDSRRPLRPAEVSELDACFRVGATYSSNAPEGNTLTLTETKVLLEDGLTAGGKSLRDCYTCERLKIPTAFAVGQRKQVLPARVYVKSNARRYTRR